MGGRDTRRKISLTGIKPTGSAVAPEQGGTLHLGSYFGAIRPALAMAAAGQHDSLYFIADYHALTTQRDPTVLRDNVYDVAANWLACGLDPERTIVYRQSDVIEVFELCWIFACIVATGQLERGHAYKDARSRSESVNAGIFNYPLLMAADIILYDSDVVPIGADQKQHLELARDIAIRMNHLYGEGTVVVPEALITEAPVVPGHDGRKMSKSYGNTIQLFAPPKALRKEIMKLKSESTPLEAPKPSEGQLVYELYKLVASEAEAEAMAQKLHAGGYGWGHAKQELFEALDAQLSPLRARYLELRTDETELERILQAGAERARVIARATIERVRAAVGIGLRSGV
ncbi:MAG: tryptophan--tRNA ligase [Myxococcales bacterium]|nr:tryptophan--tRNA ligase [Myxococcales bacterium]